jgi:hypothetical protein
MASTGRMDESVGYLKRAVELNSTNYLYISNLVFMSSYVGDHKTANWASEIFARTYPDVKDVKRDCVWEFVPAS